MDLSKIPTADGVPVALVSSSPEQGSEQTSTTTKWKPVETAKDAIKTPSSRVWLRMSAAWWRSLQYTGMTLHFMAAPRPPNPSFSRTVPSTLSQTKGEFRLQFYTPKDYDRAAETGKTYPAVVNFHGGGFIMGNATDDARFARVVTDVCDAVFVSVDYRMAPECPFPVAVDDCADALLYVVRNAADLHINPHKLATSGFSAGGNLSITSALQLRQYLDSAPPSHSSPKLPSDLDFSLRAVAAWYPTLDMTISRAERRQSSVRPDLALPEKLTDIFDQSYMHPPELRLDNPLLSPAKATDAQLTAGLPQHVLVYTCEWDMLQAEGDRFAKRLASAPIRKDVRFKMIPQVPHGWDKAPSAREPPAGAEALYVECCEWLKGVFDE